MPSLWNDCLFRCPSLTLWGLWREEWWPLLMGECRSSEPCNALWASFLSSKEQLSSENTRRLFLLIESPQCGFLQVAVFFPSWLPSRWLPQLCFERECCISAWHRGPVGERGSSKARTKPFCLNMLFWLWLMLGHPGCFSTPCHTPKFSNPQDFQSPSDTKLSPSESFPTISWVERGPGCHPSRLLCPFPNVEFCGLGNQPAA